MIILKSSNDDVSNVDRLMDMYDMCIPHLCPSAQTGFPNSLNAKLSEVRYIPSITSSFVIFLSEDCSNLII